MVVVGLVLGASPILDVVAFSLLTLHYLVDTARRTVHTIVVEATSELSLFALTVVLIDVAVSITTMPVLVDVSV
jgi:hypothetical protein